jgi:hypothetical protein
LHQQLLANLNFQPGFCKFTLKLKLKTEIIWDSPALFASLVTLASDAAGKFGVLTRVKPHARAR